MGIMVKKYYCIFEVDKQQSKNRNGICITLLWKLPNIIIIELSLAIPYISDSTRL